MVSTCSEYIDDKFVICEECTASVELSNRSFQSRWFDSTVLLSVCWCSECVQDCHAAVLIVELVAFLEEYFRYTLSFLLTSCRQVPSTSTATTRIGGSHNVVQNVSVYMTNNHGIIISGNATVVDNCLIAYTDFLGTLTYSPLGASGNQINISRATVHSFGNAGVVTDIPNQTPYPPRPPLPMAGRYASVSYSHIFNSGLIGKDTAALYTGGWNSAGLEWHHNWVHSASEKCIRADDQSRNMSVHHNVAFDCGVEPNVDAQSATTGLGMILKGNGHVVYANTIYNANYTEYCLPSCPEPLKPFRHQYPFDQHQNSRSQIFNSVANKDIGFPCSCRNKSFLNRPGGNQTGVLHLDIGAMLLRDPASFDFRPTPTSPLVDAGVVFPPYTDGKYTGKAPDVGAYENDQAPWTAGCQGLKGCDGDRVIGEWTRPHGTFSWKHKQS
eukprot:m.422045 g.422045  ORF g.422045 m.422045 type:complete len:441 (+) comp21323_c0_seq3:166-1488(+)